MKIDFHAHILPRADHGCTCSAMAEAQLRLMQRAGTDAVVATSHFYPNEHSISSFLARRQGSLDALLEKLPLADLPIVYQGAEVLVCAGMHKMEGLERLAIVGTNVILLEMPFGHWRPELYDAVLGVRARGLCPVLAHIDRYDLHNVQVLLEEGISAQVNAAAFGLFAKTAPYEALMREGRVVALGSDLHGSKAADYQRFVKMQKKLGSLADAVFAATEQLLQNATPLFEKKERVDTLLT
ncbi:MAG: hypothetical protein IJF31_03415 [Clostridia bacterium]|nr:hypothetical protein [Clostridia bacterium]